MIGDLMKKLQVLMDGGKYLLSTLFGNVNASKLHAMDLIELEKTRYFTAPRKFWCWT